jgi:hypothetical protein
MEEDEFLGEEGMEAPLPGPSHGAAHGVGVGGMEAASGFAGPVSPEAAVHFEFPARYPGLALQAPTPQVRRAGRALEVVAAAVWGRALPASHAGLPAADPREERWRLEAAAAGLLGHFRLEG